MTKHQRRYRPNHPVPHPATELWFTCPTCQKRAYPTRRLARKVARRMPPRGDGAVMRAYLCNPEIENRYHVGHVGPWRARQDLNSTGRTPVCPTACTGDCTAACHETHRRSEPRHHDPHDCPAVRLEGGPTRDPGKL